MQYRRNSEKDTELRQRHWIWFEDIESAIASGKLLDIITHPNQSKYPWQRLYIVYLQDCIYTVPYIYESEWVVFLKTIIPQRKYKKRYLSS